MTTETEQSPRDARSSNGERATVLASLTNGMFRLQMTDGREVVAHAAMDLRKAFTRLLPGDPVLVEVSPFDANKARICRLLKSPHRSQHKSQIQPNKGAPNRRELS